MREPVMLPNPLLPNAALLVEPEVLDRVFAQRQLEPSTPEAGGLLLGMRRGAHIHVVAITSPGPHDRRSRTSFHRASQPHQDLARQHWQDSGGVVDYVGEWHTHPVATPSPSAIDLREWQLLLRQRQSPLVFLIAGTGEAIWIGLGSGDQVAPAIDSTNRQQRESPRPAAAHS